MVIDLSRLKQELKIRRYSVNTAKSYIHYNKKFLEFCKKEPQHVTGQDVRDYLEHLVDKRCSSSTMRSAHNSLLFFYTGLLKNGVMEDIKIPKQDWKITVDLTPNEVARIISAIENQKHRLLIELIYASGIRGQEAVKIKVKDILIEEKLAVVRSGKGRKDRKTILSKKFIDDFSKELDTDNYLFPGRNGHLTVRSVQEIIKKAAKKAGIRKKVYPHLLRHSFATHLLKNKVDIKYISKLLGHKDIKTTERYIHISDEDIKDIQSPHDNL